MICFDKLTLLHVITNGTIIAIYSVTMILVGAALTIFAYVFAKGGRFKGLKNGLEHFVWIMRHWHELKEYVNK